MLLLSAENHFLLVSFSHLKNTIHTINPGIAVVIKIQKQLAFCLFHLGIWPKPKWEHKKKRGRVVERKLSSSGMAPDVWMMS